MSTLLIILYVVFAVGGSTLIKYGSLAKSVVMFTLPVVHTNFSLVSLLGVLCYGFSFLLYVLLLSKFDLSFISPITIGVVYVLLMFTAALLFSEQFTVLKTIGCVMILSGVLLILTNK